MRTPMQRKYATKVVHRRRTSRKETFLLDLIHGRGKEKAVKELL